MTLQELRVTLFAIDTAYDALLAAPSDFQTMPETQALYLRLERLDGDITAKLLRLETEAYTHAQMA